MKTIKFHHFQEVPTKYKEVRHYQLNGDPSEVVKEFANISVQRFFNHSQGVAFWYKAATTHHGKRTAWSNPVTGLFSTSYNNIFYGDISLNGRRVQLLFFAFSEDFTRLLIVEFPTYPINQNIITSELKSLNEVLKKGQIVI